MRRLLVILVLVGLLTAVVVAVGPLYIIEEGEHAVVTRFGEVIRTVDRAGLQVRIPFIDVVHRFPKKILSWDGDPRRVPTLENQFIWIDTTARWRIIDLQRFYASVNTLEAAYSRLDDVIESAVRTVIARNPLHEAVRNSNLINELERTRLAEDLAVEQEEARAADEVALAAEEQSIEIEARFDRSAFEELASLVTTAEEQEPVGKGRNSLSEEMFKSAAEIVPDFGIELIDIVIRQIRYSDDLTESVYDRMVSERKRIAQAYRSYGEGRKQELIGQLEREKNRILSEAYAEAQRISGVADAEAARLYTRSYSQSPAFFRFWRAMESYRKTVPGFNKIITTDSDYFRYLHSETGQ